MQRLLIVKQILQISILGKKGVSDIRLVLLYYLLLLDNTNPVSGFSACSHFRPKMIIPSLSHQLSSLKRDNPWQRTNILQPHRDHTAFAKLNQGVALIEHSIKCKWIPVNELFISFVVIAVWDNLRLYLICQDMFQLPVGVLSCMQCTASALYRLML